MQIWTPYGSVQNQDGVFLFIVSSAGQGWDSPERELELFWISQGVMGDRLGSISKTQLPSQPAPVRPVPPSDELPKVTHSSLVSSLNPNINFLRGKNPLLLLPVLSFRESHIQHCLDANQNFWEAGIPS